MATISRTLSTRPAATGEAEILLRLNISRDLRFRIKSGIFVKPDRFENGGFIYPRRNPQEAAAIREKDNRLSDLERHLITLTSETAPSQLNKELFARAVRRFHFPDEEEPAANDNLDALGIAAPGVFYDLFSKYLERPISDLRRRDLKSLARSLRRFELYKRLTGSPLFVLDVQTTTRETLDEILSFWGREHEIIVKFPSIIKEAPLFVDKRRAARQPEQKGANTITGLFKKLRAFYNWAVAEGYAAASPFNGYKDAPKERYGRPWYLTKEEREAIADADLSASPALEAQRDIFIFQCLIGCRVSDLLRLTPANIVDGSVQYIPTKTIGERPEAVTVPLTARAKAILERYKEQAETSNRILPFITAQRYNDDIKAILERCGITRTVTILNPKTGEEEQRRLCDIAGSHMARRTFCGILYKGVKDPELIGSMSGHKAGSRAFARYRDIDTETKRETLKFLE